MERFNSRTIDEMGRVTLHGELRKKLNLETGKKVSLLLVDTIIILRQGNHPPDEGYNFSHVSELGAIELPSVFLQKLGWTAADKVVIYNTDNLVIIKSEE